MSGGIYVIQGDDQLIELVEKPYDSEALLQGLLAKYPHLLAGDQMNSSDPRRWILVRREASLPAEEDGSGRWSVDHLFLDQDAIPTIVEVKRSSDTRIRREVIGQMLDYAANAVVYWSVERLRAMFEEEHGEAAEQLLGALLGPEPGSTPDQFWQQVKTNLQAGKVRLVFVADYIPKELARVVEFLNQQMDPAEVLAVEVKQYVGKNLRTLVPRVMGQTNAAQQRKTPASAGGAVWDAESFMKELTARQGTESAAVAQRILDWATDRQLQIWWGRGSKDGSLFPMLYLAGSPRWTVAVWTYGRVDIQFQYIKTIPPFDNVLKRQELLAKFNAIPGVSLPVDRINGRPSIPLAILTAPPALDQFLAVLDWLLKEYLDAAQSSPAG